MNCDVPALWNEYQKRLFQYIQKRVKDTDDAKDIHQDVLLKVYAFCQKTSGVRKIDSWLYQIAYNTIADYYNKKNSSLKLSNLDLEKLEDNNELLRGAAEYIMPLIELIPSKYGKPLILSDIHGLKQQDIANQMGLSLSAMKSRIQRARALLRKEYTTCFAIQFGASGEIMELTLKTDCEPLQKKL